MKELIDKSEIVAWIKRRIILLENNSDGIISMLASGMFVNEYKDLLSFLDTLEGKEVIAGQECVCNGVFNKIIGDSWNLTIPLDKVGLKHDDKVEVLIIKI